MNNVVLIGRLTREPELRYLPNTAEMVKKGLSKLLENIGKDEKL